MILIIKHYLASLKEREELDAILPDLLTQMGLNVISKPKRGLQEYGVDVAAVGNIDGKEEKVYLFSIKAGDLTRSVWDGKSDQSLRQSLTEIQDGYIPNLIPLEHKDKKIVICLCFGGEINAQVEQLVIGYEKQHEQKNISFERWNGDRLAKEISTYLLNEDLLPPVYKGLLRKSLSLLDDPEYSFKHFSALIDKLCDKNGKKKGWQLTSVRLLNICLRILFAWARDTGNLEAAYLSAERTLLYAWELSKDFFSKKSKVAKSIQLTFGSILQVYQSICDSFILKILPHAGKKHALSFSVRSMCELDINLKLFDLLGRIALAGIWSSYWYDMHEDKTSKIAKQQCIRAIKYIISSNPALLLPFKEDQTIDIFLALLLLSDDDANKKDMLLWLNELMTRSILAYKSHGNYPCTLQSYTQLLEHPKIGNEKYRENFTAGSVLYPTVALWAAVLQDEVLFNAIKKAKSDFFEHCAFQVWYPDDDTEKYLYTNANLHGIVITDVPVENNPQDFLKMLWNECDRNKCFDELSAVKCSIWPLTLVACRHYRIPIPIHFMLPYRDNKSK